MDWCLLPLLKRDYATEVAQKLADQGIFVDVDNSGDTLNKKIRNGEIAQYNFIFGMSSFY